MIDVHPLHAWGVLKEYGQATTEAALTAEPGPAGDLVKQRDTANAQHGRIYRRGYIVALVSLIAGLLIHLVFRTSGAEVVFVLFVGSGLALLGTILLAGRSTSRSAKATQSLRGIAVAADPGFQAKYKLRLRAAVTVLVLWGVLALVVTWGLNVLVKAVL